MRACPYQPNTICERKHCTPYCKIRIKQMRKHVKYTVPICCSFTDCEWKGQLKGLKLPICKNYDPKTGALIPCNNQFLVSYTWLLRHKPSLKKLQTMWYKYKKAGVI